LETPHEKQTWDIGLTRAQDSINFPAFDTYQWYALDGPDDWVVEQPELRRLYEQLLYTIDPAKQEDLVRRMERHWATRRRPARAGATTT
jgi:hypothetical protein